MLSKRTPNAIDKRIGHVVRMRRLELGLSQQTMAEKIGVSFQQVQKYERGLNRIAAGRLYEIARFLDLPIQVFFAAPAKAAKPAASKKKP